MPYKLDPVRECKFTQKAMPFHVYKFGRDAETWKCSVVRAVMGRAVCTSTGEELTHFKVKVPVTPNFQLQQWQI